MAAVGKTQLINNGGDASLCVRKELSGLLQIDLLTIFQDCFSRIFFHNPVQTFPVIVQLSRQLFPGAPAVAGFHDMAQLGKQVFLAVGFGVDPVHAKQRRIRQMLQQPGEGSFDKKEGARGG